MKPLKRLTVLLLVAHSACAFADTASALATPPKGASTLEERLTEISEQGQSIPFLQEIQSALLALVTTPTPDRQTYAKTVSSLRTLNQRFNQQGATVEVLQAVAAATAKEHALAATVQHDLGIALGAVGDYPNALTAFENAIALSQKSGDHTLHARGLINALNAATEIKPSRRAGDLARDALDAVEKLALTTERTELQLSLAFQLAVAQQKGILPSITRLDAFRLAQAGLKQAQNEQDRRKISIANGILGHLYEMESRYDEAFHYTRRALFAAQSAVSIELEFQWSWQIGRLSRAKKETKNALTAYGRAFEILPALQRQTLSAHSDAFEKTVLPVYTEYLDLLTADLHAQPESRDKQNALHRLRDTIEQLKLAEVENYFQNSCYQTDADRHRQQPLGGDVAVIYPVILEDRVELLVQRDSGYTLRAAKANRGELTPRINAFRENISNYRLKDDYQADAQYLYRLFVQPYEQDLQGVKTLVYVAAWMLRTIPLAALHDGKQFLIEKYALITTPSMTLTNTDRFERVKVKVLANGITEGVQGYDPLPSVANELKAIARLYGAEILRDKQFSVASAREKIGKGEFGIVHVATHGEFDSDFRRSYILGYDDKITLNTLEKTVANRRYTEHPIDLLVLSACQTAAGDDKAALGLAGVAIKAGARSALATLWFISDDATSRLIEQFYTGLKDVSLSKADALRNAQVELINSGRFKHPNFWAPFILIGNWY